jgi:hypothetical protein
MIHSLRRGLIFHELRHTAAAFTINDGADPLQVKRRMGDEDIRTTFDTYGHLFPDREEDLVAALDRRKRWASPQHADSMLTVTRGEVVELDEKDGLSRKRTSGPEGS